MTEKTQTSVLSRVVCDGIDHWLAKYPADQRRSAVLAALHIVQEANEGFLSQASLEAVADYLQIPPICVYEVATFYNMFNTKPVGKHCLEVCCNISCMLRGSDEVIAHLQKKLKVAVGETTQDGQYTLRKTECLGACIHAPAMRVGKRYYENLTPENIDQVLAELE